MRTKFSAVSRASKAQPLSRDKAKSGLGFLVSRFRNTVLAVDKIRPRIPSFPITSLITVMETSLTHDQDALRILRGGELHEMEGADQIGEPPGKTGGEFQFEDHTILENAGWPLHPDRRVGDKVRLNPDIAIHSHPQ